MALYVERGYEQTTVADIAERAGVTARTFFRYFSDKREVLFAGSADLQKQMMAALEAAPSDARPLEVVAAALEAAGAAIGGNHEFSRQRSEVINANAELRERELIKLDSLGAALADGLRARDVPDPRAGLAAEAGIAVFRVGFERWVSGAGTRASGSLAEVLRAGMDDLRALAAD